MKYYYCHGWMLDKSYNEVTCKQREKCRYFDELFYRHHGDHLDDFEEMFPFEPCQYFLLRPEYENKEDKEPSLFDMPDDFYLENSK